MLGESIGPVEEVGLVGERGEEMGWFKSGWAI